MRPQPVDVGRVRRLADGTFVDPEHAVACGWCDQDGSGLHTADLIRDGVGELNIRRPKEAGPSAKFWVNRNVYIRASGDWKTRCGICLMKID